MNFSLNVKKYSEQYRSLAQNFDSGNSHLNHFLQHLESLDSSIGTTYVLLSDNDDSIIGFYNIGMGNLDIIECGVRIKMGGAVHINGFALDINYHGLVQETLENDITINLSDFLLIDCINRIKEIRQNNIGFAFITLSATKEGYSLYKRNGFEELEDDMKFSFNIDEKECIPMYYSMDFVEI